MASTYPPAPRLAELFSACAAARDAAAGPALTEHSWITAAPTAAPLLVAEVGAFCAAFSRRSRVFWFSNVGRQRWAHLQPFYKETRITPGVQSWHCDLQALVHESVALLVPMAQRGGAEDFSLGLQLTRAVVLGAASSSLAFAAALYATLRPSRARLGQWAVDVGALAAATLLVRAQAAALARCYAAVPPLPTPSPRARLSAALAEWVGAQADAFVLDAEAAVGGLLAELAVTAGPAAVALGAARDALRGLEEAPRQLGASGTLKGVGRDWAHPIADAGHAEAEGEPPDGVSGSPLTAACDAFAAVIHLRAGRDASITPTLALALRACAAAPNAPTAESPPPPFSVLEARLVFGGSPRAAAGVSQADFLAALRAHPAAPAATAAPAAAAAAADAWPWEDWAALWRLRCCGATAASADGRAAFLRGLRRRHELGGWEWPLLSPPEELDRERLAAAAEEVLAAMAAAEGGVAGGGVAARTPLRPPPEEEGAQRGGGTWTGRPPLPPPSAAAAAAAGATPSALPLQTSLRHVAPSAQAGAAPMEQQPLPSLPPTHVGRPPTHASLPTADLSWAGRPATGGYADASALLLSPPPTAQLTAASPGSVDWTAASTMATPAPPARLGSGWGAAPTALPGSGVTAGGGAFQFPAAVQLVVGETVTLDHAAAGERTTAPPQPIPGGSAGAALITAAERAAAASRAAARP